MMTDKTISVIAPAYNHERYIENCLWSIANQSCKNMELIVIDDVSKDNTVNIIERLLNQEAFTSKFSKGINFVKHTENKGAFYSLNQGMSLAKGDYLAMINTDDYFGKNRLNILVDACERENAEFAFGSICVIDQNNVPVTTGYGKEIMKYQDLIPKCPTVAMALTRGNGTISTGNMVFSRKLYNELNGFGNYKYVHDWDFALRASLLKEPLYVPEAKYFYRVHSGNTIAEISREARNPDALEKPVNGETIGINPLVSHFMKIMKGKYTNVDIPSLKAWEYFVNVKKYYYDDDGVQWAWSEAKHILAEELTL